MADTDPVVNGEKLSEIKERARETYDLAYQYTAPHFVEIEKLMKSYRSYTDRGKWPTLSNIMIPHHFTFVQQELPFYVEYLFPDSDYIQLTPVEESMDGETVRSVESYYEHILRDIMKIKKNCLNTLQDAIKLNVGYTMVEPVYVNPKTRVTRVAKVGGEEVARDVSVESSASTKVQLSASYIPVGQVLAVGNGEGPDDGEHVVVRLRTVEELRNMKLADQIRVDDGNDRTFLADVDDLIEKARSGNLDSSYHSMSSIMYSMLSSAKIVQNAKEKVRQHTEPLIPVVEIYLRNEHIWLANGKELIRHIKDDAGLLSPLVKATPCKDYGEWFPYGKAHAGESLSRGVNVLNNAFLDLMNYSLSPARVVNTSQMTDGDRIPKHGPHTTYKIRNGDARQAVSFTTPPPLPQGAFEMSGLLSNSYNQTKGQPDALNGTGGAGLVRSGAGAFESLIQTPLARMKLGGAILEMDYLESIIERVITYSSAIVDDVERFVVPRASESGDGFALREFPMMSIRPDDLRHVFRMSLNLREKLQDSTADASMKMAEMNLLSGVPWIDQKALLIDFMGGDKRRAQRLMATPEQIQENLQLMAQQQQAEAQSTPLDQANAGREAQGV